MSRTSSLLPSGSGNPRVEVGPSYQATLGDEAIGLAAVAGLHLDRWQQDALKLMLAVRADGKWACFEYAEIVARQNGKGALLEARALAALFLLDEQLVMWSAHEYKTAMEAFRRLLVHLRKLGEQVSQNLIRIGNITVKVNNTNGEESVERLDTGQRVKFIARSKGSGRGFSGDVNIIDEAYAYTPEQHAALMPTMNARPNPQIIFTSSPPLDPTSGDILFALRARADAGGDDSLGYRDWGAAGTLDDIESIDLDDRTLWAATNPSLGVRITEETIQRLRRSMGRTEFAREILGVWPRQVTNVGLIDPREWASLARPDAETGGDVTFAFEVSHDRSYSTIAAYSPWDNGGLGEIIARHPGTEWVVPTLLELKDRWNPVAIGVDGKGPALSLVLECESAGIRRPEDPEEPQRGDLMVLSLPEMAAACGQLLDAIAQKSLFHLDDPDLTSAVLNAKTRPVGDVEVWGRRSAAVDIGPLTGITVARRVHLARIELVDREVAAPWVAYA